MSWVENLYKDYNGFHLEIPRWEVLDRGVTALWGASGSGKSSVVRVLLGLEPCPGMRWMNGDLDVAQLSVEKRNFGVVFQSYDLFPHLTGRQNILFAARARGLFGTELEKRISDFEKRLNLSSFLDRKADLLSGGEKQRIALVRALISKPRRLFLDEPFAALDEDLRENARSLLKDILVSEQVPAILITHDRRDLDLLADKVSQISHGKLATE